MSFTRQNLVNAVYERLKDTYHPPKISRHLVREALEELLEILLEAWERGERVSIRGFGSFSVYESRPRRAYDFRTGKSLLLPSQRRVRFQKSLALRD